MNVDMELVYGSEEYEELQKYFENRKVDYPVESQNMLYRLRYEYTPDEMEELDEKDNSCDRRLAIRRILQILEEIPSEFEDTSISEAEIKR